MPLLIVNGDITKMEVDAIVNAANSSLLGGGGVDGAIHRAAGRGLVEECMGLNGCETGDAKITGGYDLPAKHVIHTVGPVWHGGSFGEEELLRSCYTRSLELAVENGCESVAFPLISTGVYGYPKKEGFEVARDCIVSFLNDHDLTVYIVIFEYGFLQLDSELERDIRSFIVRKRNAPQAGQALAGAMCRGAAPSAVHAVPAPEAGAAVDECFEAEEESAEVLENKKDSLFGGMMNTLSGAGILKEKKRSSVERASVSMDYAAAMPSMAAADGKLADLAKRVSMIDESFSQMLLRKIDELGMTDVECYKKANLDRKHFSKIRSDKDYRPKKQTVLALAVALQLPLDEMRELLMKAGFALSDSSVTDVIIEYFVSKGNYNIYDINEALFAFDQPMLGAA